MARTTAPVRPEGNEALISEALGRAPDLSLGSAGEGWQLSRWRQFVGAYTLPALPAPVFAAHVAGHAMIARHGAFQTAATCATIVPAGQPTGWLVDGEQDVVMLSLPCEQLVQAAAGEQIRRMQFALVDPLGAALTRQVLAELYAPPSSERDGYLGAMVTALKAHIGRAPPASEG